MENFKFIVFTIIFLALVGLLGFWAFTTIDSGGEFVSQKELKDLREENKLLKKENNNLEERIQELTITEEKKEVVKEKEKTTQEEKIPDVYKYQTMINSIQKLANDKITMKKGSKGTRVGTVQKFLNIYNNTSNKIDNDYGKKMVTAVKDFQKDQKLTVDGQSGPGTFRKMVEWLKKQS